MLVPLLTLGALAQTPYEQKAAEAKYDAFTARVQAGDLKVDWREFRVAAQIAHKDHAYNWVEGNTRASSEFQQGKYQEGLDEGIAMERENLANPLGHLIVFSGYKYLHKEPEAAREQAITNALIASITDSGDGRSPKTAYFTVSPIEDHLFMQMILGVTSKSQSLVQQGGHAYDRIVAVDAAGKERTIWFNTDTDMEMMAHSFTGTRTRN